MKTQKGSVSAYLMLAAAFIISIAASSVAHAQIPSWPSLFVRNLMIGSTGGDVIMLQTFLETNGFLSMPPGVAKGYFGNVTRLALSKYQQSVNIQPSVGYFGPLTRAKIVAIPPKPVSEELIWNVPSERPAYEAASLYPIRSERVRGLITNGVGEIEEIMCRFEECDIKNLKPHLRAWGGYAPQYYDLKFTAGQSTVIIDSKQKLKEYFAPVESESEAVSFIGVTQSDLQIVTDADILSGQVATIGTGEAYLVKVYRRNTFGCSAHLPTPYIYKVTKQGDITLIAHQPDKPGNLCVD